MDWLVFRSMVFWQFSHPEMSDRELPGNSVSADEGNNLGIATGSVALEGLIRYAREGNGYAILLKRGPNGR
jgi:hypothetical protein